LAAGALFACSPEARSEAVLAYETATFDPKSPDPDIDFRIVFSQPPDFFTVDTNGRQAIDFQYYTPESLIRGPEIYITRTTIRIRSYGPPDPDPAAGGWGPVIATVPFILNGDTVTFSAPFDLFSSSPIFKYQFQVDVFGVDKEFITGSTAPEPSTWVMTLLGFAGLGYASYRKSRKRASFTA
jgi:hypothetical protein